MTNKFCNACGRPRAYISIGGALLCRTCAPDIRAESDRLHELGKPVNALAIAKQYFKDHNSGGSYYLRDIPRDLKLAAQHQALDEGLTLRELIFKSLEEYLQKNEAKGD